MTEDEIKNIFREKGALQEGHFRLNSGLHSEQYIQCARVLQHPDLARRLGAELARRFSRQEIEVVIGPALGGITLAFAVGLALDCRAVFTEKTEDGMELRRSFALQPGEKALVVDDVFTTGSSVREVIKTLKSQGGEPVGAGVMVDRSGGRSEEFVLPVKSLLNLDLRTYPPAECPMCSEEITCRSPGSSG